MAEVFRLVSYADLVQWTKSVYDCILCLLCVGILAPSKDCHGCHQAQSMTIEKRSEKRWKRDEGYCYRCGHCGREGSLRTGTMMEKSDKPMANWIHLMYAFVDGLGTSDAADKSQYERRQAGINLGKFRRCCQRFLEDNFELLGGEDFIVEIDEAAFNKRQKHHHGTGGTTRWVFGMVCRETGACKFVFVNNRERETLIPQFRQYVAEATTVHSDMWRAYWVLGDYNYIHRMVNHADNLVDRVTGVHTNTIEGIWKWAKRAVLGKGGCPDHQLQERLDEFAFRQTFCRDKNTRFIAIARVIASYWNLID